MKLVPLGFIVCALVSASCAPERKLEEEITQLKRRVDSLENENVRLRKKVVETLASNAYQEPDRGSAELAAGETKLLKKKVFTNTDSHVALFLDRYEKAIYGTNAATSVGVLGLRGVSKKTMSDTFYRYSPQFGSWTLNRSKATWLAAKGSVFARSPVVRTIASLSALTSATGWIVSSLEDRSLSKGSGLFAITVEPPLLDSLNEEPPSEWSEERELSLSPASTPTEAAAKPATSGSERAPAPDIGNRPND